jgi:hypothetical protein
MFYYSREQDENNGGVSSPSAFPVVSQYNYLVEEHGGGRAAAGQVGGWRTYHEGVPASRRGEEQVEREGQRRRPTRGNNRDDVVGVGPPAIPRCKHRVY